MHKLKLPVGEIACTEPRNHYYFDIKLKNSKSICLICTEWACSCFLMSSMTKKSLHMATQSCTPLFKISVLKYYMNINDFLQHSSNITSTKTCCVLHMFYPEQGNDPSLSQPSRPRLDESSSTKNRKVFPLRIYMNLRRCSV